MFDIQVNRRAVCLAILLCVAGTARGESQPERAKLASRFRQAANETERLMVAIAFVDGGFISRGTKVAVVDEVFGTAFVRQAEKIEGNEVDWGIVPIGRFVVPPKGVLASPFYAGWVLTVSFDRRGLVSQYYLTKELK